MTSINLIYAGINYFLNRLSFRLYALFLTLALFLALPALVPAVWVFEVGRATWAILLLSVTLLLDGCIRIGLWEGLVGRQGKRPVPSLLPEVGSTLILIAAVSLILNQLYDLSLAGILAASGLVGIAAGFALRGLLSDMFSGIALNLDRSMGLGDWIDITYRGSLFHGEIIEMNWRTIHLCDRDANLVIIPNSEFSSSIIKNRSRPANSSRYWITLALDHHVPIDRASRILASGLHKAARADAILCEPAPSVMLTGTQGNLVNYGLYYYINPTRHSPTNAQHVVHEQALKALIWAGLNIAVPREEQTLLRKAPGDEPDFSDDRLAALAHAPLFAPLCLEERRELASLSTMVSVAAKHDLLHQGDPGTSMYILLEGALDVLVARSDGGPPTLVGSLSPGDGVGEVSLLTGAPRSASVRAATDCLLLEIDKAAIAPILGRNPALIDALSHLLSDHQAATILALTSTEAAHATPTGDGSVVTQIARHIRRFLGHHATP